MEDERSSKETLQGEPVWNSDDFRRYLLALAYNTSDRTYSLEQRKFPTRIDLATAWHETFDWMRKATTQDRQERWSMVVINQRRNKLFISPAVVVPDSPRSRFEADLMSLVFHETKRRHMPFWIADIHSHPPDIPKLPTLARLREKAKQTFTGTYTEDDFSESDLYGLVFRRYHFLDRPLSARFLVGPSENKAVFRSQESDLTDLTETRFRTLWHSQYSDPHKRNLAIVQHHRLAFYRGRPGQPLLRVFP